MVLTTVRKETSLRSSSTTERACYHAIYNPTKKKCLQHLLTRKRFLYLRSCNGFILVRLSKAGYRFRVNAEDGYRGSAVSCSVFLTTQMGRYGLQANHVSFKNRKNSKKWPIRRRHFFGRLKNEIVVRTFLRRGMSSSASDQSF